MLTTTIHGRTVLAKKSKYGVDATTYANQTQADKSAAKVKAAGVDCWVMQSGRCFYVVIAEAPVPVTIAL